MIKINNLKKRKGKRFVLDIPELLMERGKIHVIIGSNGAGKTTLLRLIGRIDKPDSGIIKTDTDSLNTVLCFQKPYMFAGTVKDNIMMGLKFRKKDGRNVSGIMEKFRITQLAEQNAKTLSAGETQRVSLARSLILNPEILLLDEPAANVDPESVEIIESTVRELSRNGMTVVMATHLTEKAYHLSKNVLRLENGHLAPPELRNVFSGIIDRDKDLAYMKISENLRFNVVTELSGKVRAAVSPADIILSFDKLESSMLNIFPGRISGLQKEKNFIDVSVDIGVILISRITPFSLRKMNLTIGSEVYASFKANAVKVF